MEDFSEDEIKVLKRLIEAIEAVTKLKPNIPAYQIATLLRVGVKEGRSVKWYSETSHLPTSTMSRALLDLGKMYRNREPGLGLVEERPSPTSLREHEMYLTPKGQALLRRISQKLLAALQ